MRSRSMPWFSRKKQQIPIVFSTTVLQVDWDAVFGGWRCSAIRIPGAQVNAIFVDGKRQDSALYEVMYELAMIRWITRPQPEQAFLTISLTEKLSTEELTRRWRILAIILPSLTTVLAVLIPILLSSHRSQPSSNPEEHIVFDLSTPVLGECGEVKLDGYVGVTPGSQRKITRLFWDWGDGSVSDSFLPAIHRYSRNGKYSIKVTGS